MTLDDVTRAPDNPLANVRQLLLRNANSESRIPGHIVDFGSLGQLTVTRRDAEFPGEGGVVAVEDRLPVQAKPSQIMKKFKNITARAGEPAARTDTMDIGTPGVSAMNQMGHVGHMPYTANRGGSGIVHGQLHVSYDKCREATAEALKWGTVKDVKYNADDVSMTVMLAPQYYEPFAVHIQNTCGESARFESQMTPPMFVADIGKNPTAKRDRTARRVGTAQSKRAHPGHAPAAAAGPTVTFSGQPWADAHAPGPDEAAAALAKAKEQAAIAAEQRMRERGSEEAIFAQELRLEKQSTQDLVNSKFRALAYEGRAEALRGLIRRGWQVHADRTPHQERRAAGYERKRQYYINKQREDEERTGLRKDMWLEEGAEPLRVFPQVDAVDDDGDSALHWAAKGARLEVVQELLELRVRQDRANSQGCTALDIAKAVSEKASADVFIRRPGATERKRAAAQIVLLLDSRSLLKTVQQGDYRRAKFLIEQRGHAVQTTNRYGMTSLHFAVMNLDVAMIALLAQHGADPHVRNNNGQSAAQLIQTAECSDALKAKMQAAIGEGRAAAKQLVQAQMRERRALAKEAEALDELGKQLRRTTRGTSAAVAVFQAFQSSGSRPSSQATSRITTKSVAARIPPDASVQALRTVPVRQPEGQIRLAPAGADALDWRPSKDKNTMGLAASWNRHALSMFRKQMQQKALDAYTSKKRADPRKAGIGEVAPVIAEAAVVGRDVAQVQRAAEMAELPPTTDPAFETWVASRFNAKAL